MSSAISECSNLTLSDLYSSDSEEEMIEPPPYSPLSSADADDIPEDDVGEEVDTDVIDNEGVESPTLSVSLSWC